ncbi:MAG: hypothetical protein VYA51_12875 [Planctomycetota bacterium]|nr:hypothetical protein [Planctomycetota bacterium]
MNDPYRPLPVVRNACAQCIHRIYKNPSKCMHDATGGWDRVEGYYHRSCRDVRAEQSTDACPWFDKKGDAK